MARTPSAKKIVSDVMREIAGEAGAIGEKLDESLEGVWEK